MGQMLQQLHKGYFRGEIKKGGGFVEQYHGGALRQGFSYEHALPFTVAQGGQRAVTERQRSGLLHGLPHGGGIGPDGLLPQTLIGTER